MNYITERNYGDSFDSRADLVILCPHGSLGRSFIEEHRLYDLVDGVNLFDSFNKIEADIGSFELANAIASKVAQIRDGILVRVIEVNIPRSVIE